MKHLERWIQLLTCILLLGGATSVRANQNPAETIQTFIQNGQLEKAAQHLHALEGPEYQVKRFYGLIALKKGNAVEAATLFERVLELKPEWKSTYLYLAQAQLHLERYAAAISSLQKCHELAQDRPGYYRLRIRAELGIKNHEKALEIAEQAQSRFPQASELQFDSLWVLTKVGLIHTALDQAQALLTRPSNSSANLLLLARIARHGIRYPKAKALLEQLLHTHPNQGPLRFEAGLGYAQLGLHKVSARFFEQADQLGHPAAFEAADQYRLAQDSRKALELNARMVPGKKQLEQRLTIYLSAKDYHRATALEPLLTRRKFLNDESRYRLGYAYVQVQDIDRAQKMALRIEDSSRQQQLNALISRVQSSDTSSRFR